MYGWTDWIDLPEKELTKEQAKQIKDRLDDYGIYEIRRVTLDGDRMSIPRLIGQDEEGVIYVGRSGIPARKIKRTIATRVIEFCKGEHSGSQTYREAKKVLGPHKLQVRGLFLEQGIKDKERQRLVQYLERHAELPPCNSSLPGEK